VVEIETSLDPTVLLDRLQSVERMLGRTRGSGTPEDRRYEPRPLDIDILLYGDRVISGPDHLHVPHLLMHERGFVLHPLAELAPELEHPVLYQTIRDLLEALEDEHQVLMADLPRRWYER
jgi:7,8-dihydro-6-hydroxymethylpterin-pyrophosphokinase